MRQKLEKNYQLKLKNNNLQKSFIIDSFVGEGASCLVYDAKYIDELGIIRNVRIKELYPLECNSNRDGNNIIWPSEEKKEYYGIKFETLYKRQIYFQNLINFTNSSTQIIDNLYEANNTKYIILDCANGKTFDKYQPNHLQNIFEVLLSLTKLVKKYHDEGYLLLDIKPENFITIDETNQLIKYLDFDSIMSLYVIKNNNVSGLSCSLKYAAPELLRGDIYKINKCSDIYSIGAILYKKIFDLDVTSNERSIGFNPNYENKYFININPKIYKKCTNFFRKTLCNNSKRRYQDCDEMIHDLEELIEISNPNSCVLISSAIIQNNYFIGRYKECLEITQAFHNGKQMVFMNGYGGIGKTELAKYYAKSKVNEYHTIIFGKCTNGLKEVFENDEIFTIKNLRKDDVSLEERINIIKQLVDEDTLIVIDNLDVLNDPYFETLCSFNCKILITTRANLDGIISNTDTTQIIEIEPLYLEDAFELFTYYYKRNIDDTEKQAIYELIQYMEGFTLMIPILAKQMMLESIVPSTMLNKLKNSKLKGISNSLIKHYKDNNIINATAYNQALGLFDFFELNNEEKEILYIMSLLGNISISKRTLALFAGQFNLQLFDVENLKKDFVHEIEKLKEVVNVSNVNSLIEKGYLDYDSTYDLVRCHNIIREISIYEFNISLLDTTVFKDLFVAILNKLRKDFIERNQTFITFSEFKEHDCLDSVYENELKQLCFNIFDHVDFVNHKNQEFISKNLLKYIMISGKNFSNIINKYQKVSSSPTLEFILLCCDWIQELCVNAPSEQLIEKLEIISNFKFEDTFMHLKNLNSFINEISMHPHTWTLHVNTLLSIKEYIEMYEEELWDYENKYSNSNNKIKGHKENRQIFNIEKNNQYKLPLKSYYSFIEHLNYSIKNNAYDLVESDMINSVYTKDEPEDKPEEENIIDIKDINVISDNHYVKYGKKRSLHKVSNYCQDDIKNFEFKKTVNDIEIPILLTLIDRYLSHGEISIEHNATYIKSSSAFSHINENMYEYLARQNDYMFMTLQLKQFNSFKKLNYVNVENYLFYSYRLNTAVGKILADLGEPSVLLEMLRIYCTYIITKENLYNGDSKKNIVDFFGKTSNHSVNEFYKNCKEIGKKYNNQKLLNLVEKSKRDIIGIDISYHDYELGSNHLIDSEIMWDAIEKFFNKIKEAKTEEEFNYLRDEIMISTQITSFFKIKLLNCINPKITFFDALLIDEEYISKKYSYDPKLLEELLEKENNGSFEGIEEILNLLEICLQYCLIGNGFGVNFYIIKINEYVDNHIFVDNQFDGLIFKLVFEFVKLMIKFNFDVNYKSLVYSLYVHYIEFENKFIHSLDEYLDDLENNIEFENKNSHIKYLIQKDGEELMELYDSYEKRFKTIYGNNPELYDKLF